MQTEMSSKATRVGPRVALLLSSAFPLWGCASEERAARAPRPDGTMSAGTVAITHVSVVDVEHGRLVADQTVVVRDRRIAAVGPAVL